MRTDKQGRQHINKLSVSIRLFRSRKRKQAGDNNLKRRASEEIDELVRQKIVRQLHDGLSQTVSALAMRTNFARRMMDGDPIAAKKELEKVEDLARDTTKEIRNLIFTLRPAAPGSHGLIESLELLVEKMDELFNLKINLEVDENMVTQLSMIDQRIIYNMVDEAVESARKRNGSTSLTVRLNTIDQQVAQLEIEDCEHDSSKIEYPFQAAEMDSIQEFGELIGGSVRVINEGTKIQVFFPYPRQSENGIQPES
jgi:two-component system sensor histidine kinase DegS